MYGTDHDILYLHIRNSAPQDQGGQRPLQDGPIDQDRQRASGRHTAPLVEVLEMNY
jgi:hypothetical protein